ncbi:MAG: hypothetical protein OK454_07160 [Thaumarchaeota archaeon]|nr:hypothetical protein [Nitrososphaerota archaeon]
MSSSGQATEMASAMSELSVEPSKQAPGTKASAAKPPKMKKKVADSWEDEDVSSSSEEESSPGGQEDKSIPSAPPPTPRSPTYDPAGGFASLSPPPLPHGSDGAGSARRPEKTDAVARRMIAGALGLKTPKMTEEQRAYGKAIEEKERRRRAEERAAEKKRQEEAERAKKAIWED